MKKIRRALSMLLASGMVFAIAGCQKEITSEDLMANIEETDASAVYLDDGFCSNYCQAAFSLLSNEYSADGPNVVVSPIATFYNLSMLANGASRGTKTKLERLIFPSYNTDGLNTFMHSIKDNMKNVENAKFYFGNSIWYNSDKNANASDEFLTVAKSYYDASAFKDSFSDGAVGNINNWASNFTEMYTENIIDSLPSDAPLFMASIATIDADWESPISPENVLDSTFTTSASEEQNVRMMSSYETVYFCDDEVQGFMKNYAGGNYAFVAIIPVRDNPITTYLPKLSGGKYYFDLMSDYAGYRIVDASIPKFSCQYKGSMKSALEYLGISEITDTNSKDLDNMGSCDGQLYIGDMTVCTGINVTESGTSKGTGAKVDNSDIGTNVVTVTLNRPFIFAVVDTQRYLPLILGIVNSVNE